VRLRSLRLVAAALLTACPAPPPPKPPALRPAPAGWPKEVPGTSIRFTGGDGSSLENAIVIEGVTWEMNVLAVQGWFVRAALGAKQATVKSFLLRDGKHYDEIEVDTGGRVERFYFDITPRPGQ
jgi:hypothetical protein